MVLVSLNQTRLVKASAKGVGRQFKKVFPDTQITPWSWTSWRMPIWYGFRLGVVSRPTWFANYRCEPLAFMLRHSKSLLVVSTRLPTQSLDHPKTSHQENSETVSYYIHPSQTDIWFHRLIDFTPAEWSEPPLLDGLNRLCFMSFVVRVRLFGSNFDSNAEGLQIAAEDFLGTNPISDRAAMARALYDPKGYRAGEEVLRARTESLVIHERRLSLVALSQSSTRSGKKEIKFDELWFGPPPSEHGTLLERERVERDDPPISRSLEDAIDAWSCPKLNEARFPDRFFGLYNVLLVERKFWSGAAAVGRLPIRGSRMEESSVRLVFVGACLFCSVECLARVSDSNGRSCGSAKAWSAAWQDMVWEARVYT